jgi:DNA-binding response OmpR family regulator
MLHILLIDDSAFFRKLAGLQFTAPNYFLDTEMTGKAGLEKALNFDYDLVITDLNLPDLSGLELIQALRVHKKDLPVILNSTKDSLEVLNLSELDSKIYFCDKQLSGLVARVGAIMAQQKRNRK